MGFLIPNLMIAQTPCACLQAIRNKLAYKMLPKIVVKKMKTGEKLAEYFDCVTVFFSTVVEFQVT